MDYPQMSGYVAPRSFPAGSVEFEMLTTEPDWGKPEVAFDLLVRRKDTGEIVKDEEGNPLIDEWKALSHFTRDFRLGNIMKSVHDPQFNWSYAELPAQILLLRNGALKKWAVATLATTVSIFETSQSIGGFTRKNSRTFISEGTTTHTENSGGGGGLLGKFFNMGGGKPKNNGGY